MYQTKGMVTPVDSHTLESLTSQIIDLCADIHRAEYRLLTLIRKLDAIEGWNAEMPSCAHWLNVGCGLDLVTAREKVRVAHALEGLPVVDEAFADGRLSYSKVRAMTRIATPASQHEFVEFAASTTAAHVEQYVRARRQAERLADPRAAGEAHRHRSFTCHTTEDGSLVFEGRLPAEQGAMFRLALERAMDWVYREAAEQVREEPAAEVQEARAARAGGGPGGRAAWSIPSRMCRTRPARRMRWRPWRSAFSRPRRRQRRALHGRPLSAGSPRFRGSVG